MSRGNGISVLMRTMVRPASFGLLAGVTRTHPNRPMGPAKRVPWGHWLEQLQNTKINTTVRAFQTKHVFWSRMPHCAGLAISAFRNLYKHNSRCYYSYYSIVITGNLAIMTFQITGHSTGSGNGLALNRRQAITWTNETSTLSHWRRNHLWYRNGVVITVTPHERHDVSNHQSLDCSFNSMSWLIAELTHTLSHWIFNHL